MTNFPFSTAALVAVYVTATCHHVLRHIALRPLKGDDITLTYSVIAIYINPVVRHCMRHTH